MRSRRVVPFGLIVVSIFLARNQARAELCTLDGWLGTQLTFRPAALPGEIGWEAGVLPLGTTVGRESCLRIGPGVKLTYADGFHSALVARLSLGDEAGFFARQLYVQGGPLVADRVHGFDVEAGVDWGFAAVFLAANRFEGSGDSLPATLTMGVRFSFLSAAAFYVLMGMAAH